MIIIEKNFASVSEEWTIVAHTHTIIACFNNLKYETFLLPSSYMYFKEPKIYYQVMEKNVSPYKVVNRTGILFCEDRKM